MSYIRWLKGKYLVLALLGGGILGLLNFITKTNDFWQEFIIGRLSKPEIIQFALSPSSQGYEDIIESKFAEGIDNIRTFSLINPLFTSPSLVLAFTIRNKSKNDIIIDRVTYDVLEIGQVKSLTPGPIHSAAKYEHTINWSKGKQLIRLEDLFSIPAESAGAFTINLTVKNADYGAGIIAKIIFTTTDNIQISTEKFQLYLPKSPDQSDISLRNKRIISLGDLHVKSPGEDSFIDNIFITSNLKTSVVKYKLDNLDQDVLFYNALHSNDYNSFKNHKSDRSGMTYGQMFDDNNLRSFWIGVRENFIWKDDTH